MGYTNIFGGMLYSFTQTFIRTHKDFHAVVVFTLRVVCTLSAEYWPSSSPTAGPAKLLCCLGN